MRMMKSKLYLAVEFIVCIICIFLKNKTALAHIMLVV